MIQILTIITGTPLWVWPLLAVLIARGVRALRPSTIHLYKLFIMPVVLLGVSLGGLLRSCTIQPYFLSIWLLMALLGGLFVWLVIKKQKILVDRKKRLLRVPGSIVTLLIILGVFGVRYYFGYLNAIRPDLVCNPHFIHARFAIAGFMAGILLGRLGIYLHRYTTEPQTDLA